MSRLFRSGRGRASVLAISAAAGIAGTASIAVAVDGQQSAPQPPARSAHAPVATDPAALPAPSHSAADHSAHRSERSAPVAISVPAIGVHARFVSLGLNSDGSIQVPPDVTHVGWYRLGPVPGQLGPAIVLGHVDSAKAGPGVFFRLGALHPGDEVTIALADGTHVVFTVYAVREYPKDHFPTATAYSNTNDPQLRLITCGGSFDAGSGHYRSNIVAFARAA